MASISALALVLVIVFASIAMQLFSGMLLKRCVKIDTISLTSNFTNEVWLLDSDAEQIICNIEHLN
jgi:hypothetical protein